MGGYDGLNHISEEVKWAPLLQTSMYKVQLEGVSMNNHMLAHSKDYNVGFIDSGTTFSYLPN